MKKLYPIIFAVLTVFVVIPCFGFIGGGGGNSGTADFANEAFHAETIDNAFGTNVVLSGSIVVTNSYFSGVGNFIDNNANPYNTTVLITPSATTINAFAVFPKTGFSLFPMFDIDASGNVNVNQGRFTIAGSGLFTAFEVPITSGGGLTDLNGDGFFEQGGNTGFVDNGTGGFNSVGGGNITVSGGGKYVGDGGGITDLNLANVSSPYYFRCNPQSDDSPSVDASWFTTMPVALDANQFFYAADAFSGGNQNLGRYSIPPSFVQGTGTNWIVSLKVGSTNRATWTGSIYYYVMTNGCQLQRDHWTVTFTTPATNVFTDYFFTNAIHANWTNSSWDGIQFFGFSPGTANTNVWLFSSTVKIF